jgi:L-lactate utilization protein LutB
MVTTNTEKAATLAYTCLTYGRCKARYPVNIDVPEMITKLRKLIIKGEPPEGRQ